MNIVVKTPPGTEFVSLAEAKAHLRVDDDEDDAYIGALIVAARMRLEEQINRCFLTTGLRAVFDGFPVSDDEQTVRLFRAVPARAVPLFLPRPPLIAVASVKYLDENEAEQTLDPVTYRVDVDGFEGSVVMKGGEPWPATVADQPSTVSVEFTAGYGDTADKVPAGAAMAVKILVAHMYLNREPVAPGTWTPMPLSALWFVETINANLPVG